MPRAVAINVGANTNAPGVRGPVHPDGRFEFVPIPEPEPVAEPVPTYRDLDLETAIPADALDAPVHLDPEFAEYPSGERYTYGDPFGVKARPLLDLDTGDLVLFYATLSMVGEPTARQPPEWGAYLIGGFELAADPVSGEAYRALPAAERERFATNAHCKRETFDARVLLAGDPDGSGLYDRAIPLSAPTAGVDANELVTELSSDSGKGPWWRRPLRFDGTAAATLWTLHEARGRERLGSV
ncbi:hypothetical protein [Halococcus salsus]|uniref:Nmad3 family putative nucleotide modification protein n=1 Tax=Halococcus salsus TaxID=2162894 RepID=UPI001356FD34|nr:hypothetical protein [Halococcus salsus]